VLKGAEIIACTTTGAAKYKEIIRKAECKIIIVEEAAQISEAHIATSLNEWTQQLIMIGDHQQLRPPANLHFLTLKYNFDLSMFERLINNDFQ